MCFHHSHFRDEGADPGELVTFVPSSNSVTGPERPRSSEVLRPQRQTNDERSQTGVRTRAPSGRRQTPSQPRTGGSGRWGVLQTDPPGPQDRWAPGGIKPGLRRLGDTLTRLRLPATGEKALARAQRGSPARNISRADIFMTRARLQNTGRCTAPLSLPSLRSHARPAAATWSQESPYISLLR